MNQTLIYTLLACAAAMCLLAPAAARAAELHVATSGNDANPGTQAAPLRTIQRAADLAQPGDVITVHEGVYRERVNPPRGGESDAKRIVYQAAPGEKVEIKGSEVVKNWVKVQDDVWKVTLPNSFFGSFNPYSDLIRGDWFNPKGREHHTGAVYLNGDWLIEAAKLDEVLKPAGDRPRSGSARWTRTNTTIWAQFKGVNPNEQLVEINVRQTVFYPDKPGVNYITVRGFTMRHAATPWAPPTAEQIGLIGTHWSKGWIIENNVDQPLGLLRHRARQTRRRVRQHLGQHRRGLRQDHRARQLKIAWTKENIGHHIVRNNTISHCEQAGIVGSLGAVVQHRHRQHHPRHPRPAAVHRRRDGGHQVPRRHRHRDQRQPHLPDLPRTLAGLDGAGHARLAKPLPRQRRRGPVRRGEPRAVPGGQQPLPVAGRACWTCPRAAPTPTT